MQLSLELAAEYDESTRLSAFIVQKMKVLFFIYQAEFTIEQNTSPEGQVQNEPASAVDADKDNSASEGSAIDTIIREIPPPFTFAVYDESNNKICILAKFTATFTITYESAGGEKSLSVNVRPEDPQVHIKGHCGTLRQEPLLEISWPGFKLSMIFTTTKSKGKAVPDSWELMTMEFLYNTGNALFDGAINGGSKKARSSEDYPLFHTRFGKSYFCPSPDVIPMYNSKKERVVLARLQEIMLQVYDVQMAKFSPPVRCPQVGIGGAEPFAQDETVPIAVGSTLAVMAVIVVIGYALWRNMAIRKTEYNYME